MALTYTGYDTAFAQATAGSTTLVTTTATATVAALTGSAWIFVVHPDYSLVPGTAFYSASAPTLTVAGVSVPLTPDASGVYWAKYAPAISTASAIATYTVSQYGLPGGPGEPAEYTGDIVVGATLVAYSNAKQVAPTFSALATFASAAAQVSHTTAGTTGAVVTLGTANTITSVPLSVLATTPTETDRSETLLSSAGVRLTMLASTTPVGTPSSTTWGYSTTGTGNLVAVEILETPVAGVFVSDSGNYKITIEYQGTASTTPATATPITVHKVVSGTDSPLTGIGITLLAATANQFLTSSRVIALVGGTVIRPSFDGGSGTAINGTFKLLVERVS
jgi:hypothetical protein